MPRLTRRSLLTRAPLAAAVIQGDAPKPRHIRTIDIIHHSHTDVGFTDLPSVCRDMQVRFLDAALEACLADPRFHWTCEAMLTVDDWWRNAPAPRREQLLRMIRRGQMDVMALPFNQAPFNDARQWRQMLDWVDAGVWKSLQPRAAMQNDVNGCPRAGALALLDRGIRHLLMGINADSGGPPFRRPTAFWWQMPDQRRLFVWMGDHYGVAYSFFAPKNWIRSQPRGAATAFRPPRKGDFHHTDEASLAAAQRRLFTRLQRIEDGGYDFPRLILSYTNQWRYDNDPPLVWLAGFIEAWNRAGLEPALRFTTATDAVMEMEKSVSARLAVKRGEWTDWWANGDASGPREVAASRFAKRSLAAALSPVWGPVPASAEPSIQAVLKDLCLFDEHTWGANESISRPDSLFTLGQYTEKSLLAYRPMAHAEWLLGRRARTKLDPGPEGFYLVNTAGEPWSGWVDVPEAAQRNSTTPVKRLWADRLPAFGVVNWTKPAEESRETPRIEKDAHGWPSSASWPAMKKPLFAGELGHVLAVEVIPPADRGAIAQMHSTADRAQREQMRAKAFQTTEARYGAASIEENGHTLVFTQPFEHSRLANAQRVVELWRTEPRARVTVRFTRTSSRAPELFFVTFTLPVEGRLPVFSNGGVPFVPFEDQLEGSCRDYFAIDSWAHYTAPEGDWLWVTRDAPLVAIGGPHPVARITEAPADKHRLLARVFDNFWHTNFVADSHGEMEFRFELAWRERFEQPARSAETLLSEPVVLINPALRESAEIGKTLFRP
jgi:alpha-mannosidase